MRSIPVQPRFVFTIYQFGPIVEASTSLIVCDWHTVIEDGRPANISQNGAHLWLLLDTCLRLGLWAPKPECMKCWHARAALFPMLFTSRTVWYASYVLIVVSDCFLCPLIECHSRVVFLTLQARLTPWPSVASVNAGSRSQIMAISRCHGDADSK